MPQQTGSWFLSHLYPWPVRAYLQQVPVHSDRDPVVGGEGDGQQGRRHETEDGGEGQGHGTTEAHHYNDHSLSPLNLTLSVSHSL